MADKPHWFYQQSGVIPCRLRDGQLEVLLITSRKKKRWIIPKGIIEFALTARESAVKEAEEEAGVLGKVSSERLGAYEYSKWGGTCRVEVFVLRVTKVRDEWQESRDRQREWLSVEKAARRVREEDLKSLILQLPEYLKKTEE